MPKTSRTINYNHTHADCDLIELGFEIMSESEYGITYQAKVNEGFNQLTLVFLYKDASYRFENDAQAFLDGTENAEGMVEVSAEVHIAIHDKFMELRSKL